MKIVINSEEKRLEALARAELELDADISRGFVFSGDGALYPCDRDFQIDIMCGLLSGKQSRDIHRKDGQMVTLTRKELEKIFTELDDHLARVTAHHAGKVKKYASAAIL